MAAFRLFRSDRFSVSVLALEKNCEDRALSAVRPLRRAGVEALAPSYLAVSVPLQRDPSGTKYSVPRTGFLSRSNSSSKCSGRSGKFTCRVSTTSTGELR